LNKLNAKLLEAEFKKLGLQIKISKLEANKRD